MDNKMNLCSALESMNLQLRVATALEHLDGQRGKTAEEGLSELDRWELIVDPLLVWEAGLCTYPPKRIIQIHSELMRFDIIERTKDREETILHEVGHILVSYYYGRSQWATVNDHSPTWRYVMRLLEAIANPIIDRQYLIEYAIEHAPYRYYCMRCEKTFPRKTPPNVSLDLCHECLANGTSEILIPIT